MQILLLILALLQLAMLFRLERRLWSRTQEEATPEEEPEPDPETARKAAEAINRFNAGVANILGYDAEEEGSA